MPKTKKQVFRTWSDLYAKIDPDGDLLPVTEPIEQSVLGALLINPAIVEKTLDIIGTRETPVFFSDRHQYIYQAAQKIHERKDTVDLLTVTDQLRRDSRLKDIGGPGYLVELTQGVVTTANVEAHAKMLLEKHAGRRIIMLAENARLRAKNDLDDAYELATELEGELAEIGAVKSEIGSQHVREFVKPVLHGMEEAEKRDGKVSGIPTGIRVNDELTNGWQKSDLIVGAGRPGSGKTAWLLNAARACVFAESPKACMLFSLEMSSEQLTQRLICQEAGVNSDKARKGLLNDEEWRKITAAAGRILSAPLYIDDTAGLNSSQIRARFRKQKARTKDPFGLIGVDYIQKMGAEAAGFIENRETIVSKNVSGLKNLAKESNLPVIALAQLNRKLEERPDKRPTMSDLRESGAIEQEANLIFFLYRPEVYNIMVHPKTNEPTEKMIEWIWAKNRDGPVYPTFGIFDQETGRFYDRPTDFAAADREWQADLAF